MAHPSQPSDVPEDDYECTECYKAFVTFQELVAHKKEMMADGDGHLHCEICQSFFRLQYSLKEHMKEYHAKPQDLPCPGCGTKFTRLAGLMVHLDDDKCPKISASALQKARLEKALLGKDLGLKRNYGEYFLAWEDLYVCQEGSGQGPDPQTTSHGIGQAELAAHSSSEPGVDPVAGTGEIVEANTSVPDKTGYVPPHLRHKYKAEEQPSTSESDIHPVPQIDETKDENKPVTETAGYIPPHLRHKYAPTEEPLPLAQKVDSQEGKSETSDVRNPTPARLVNQDEYVPPHLRGRAAPKATSSVSPPKENGTASLVHSLGHSAGHAPSTNGHEQPVSDQNEDSIAPHLRGMVEKKSKPTHLHANGNGDTPEKLQQPNLDQAVTGDDIMKAIYLTAYEWAKSVGLDIPSPKETTAANVAESSHKSESGSTATPSKDDVATKVPLSEGSDIGASRLPTESVVSTEFNDGWDADAVWESWVSQGNGPIDWNVPTPHAHWADPDSPTFDPKHFFLAHLSQYQCSRCSVRFQELGLLVVHLKDPMSHTPQAKAQCPCCGKLFKNIPALVSHCEAETRKCRIRKNEYYRRFLDQLTAGIIDVDGQHEDKTSKYVVTEDAVETYGGGKSVVGMASSTSNHTS